MAKFETPPPINQCILRLTQARKTHSTFEQNVFPKEQQNGGPHVQHVPPLLLIFSSVAARQLLLLPLMRTFNGAATFRPTGATSRSPSICPQPGQWRGLQNTGSGVPAESASGQLSWQVSLVTKLLSLEAPASEFPFALCKKGEATGFGLTVHSHRGPVGYVKQF